MRYPKEMKIGAETVGVEVLDHPLYEIHVCPNEKCRGYQFPVPFGEKKACPACGTVETQPIDNTYVLGLYVTLENKIKFWHSDAEDIKKKCETSFVHETIEAIDEIHDLKLNHTQITALASSLLQAFSSGGVSFAEAA